MTWHKTNSGPDIKQHQSAILSLRLDKQTNIQGRRRWGNGQRKGRKEKIKAQEVKIRSLEACKSDVIIVVLAHKKRTTFPLASRGSIINKKKKKNTQQAKQPASQNTHSFPPAYTHLYTHSLAHLVLVFRNSGSFFGHLLPETCY